MEIPGYLLPHTISVQPYAGVTGAGAPAYGSAVEMAAMVERGRKLMRTAGREQVVSTARAFVQLDQLDSVPAKSRVTLTDGTVATIWESIPMEAGDLPVPAHVEIVLI